MCLNKNMKTFQSEALSKKAIVPEIPRGENEDCTNTIRLGALPRGTALKWILTMLLFAGGCATLPPETPDMRPAPPQSTLPIPESPETPPPAADARARAARGLVRQARNFLSGNQPDPAIQVLERALQTDPGSGESYFYLSQAWLLKGNREQALEFNRLAEIHLQEDTEWIDRVLEQRMQIEKE